MRPVWMQKERGEVVQRREEIFDASQHVLSAEGN
jgi:hypothetical protein